MSRVSYCSECNGYGHDGQGTTCVYCESSGTMITGKITVMKMTNSLGEAFLWIDRELLNEEGKAMYDDWLEKKRRKYNLRTNTTPTKQDFEKALEILNKEEKL